MLYPTRLVCLVALATGVLGTPLSAQGRSSQPERARTAAATAEQRGGLLRGSVTYEVLEQTADGFVVEIRAPWRRSLSQDVAALNGGSLGSYEDAALALAAASARYAEPIALPTKQAPSVSVLAASFDEAPVQLAPAVAAALSGSPGEVVAVGTERRRPAGTLLARLLRYDAERDQLLRYRRLVLAVRYADAFASAEVARRTSTDPAGVSAGTPFAGAALRAGGATNPHVPITRSVLAEGTWFKLPVSREGVFRIDRSWIEAAGLDAGSVDPSQVRVYTNGGERVPAANGAPRPADLVETPRLVTGGGDGAFGGDDAVVFFAEGARGWRWDAEADDWAHWLNPMTRVNYAFVRVDAAPGGAAVGAAAFPNWPGVPARDRIEARAFQEEDVRGGNLERKGAGGGLDWFGRSVQPSAPRLVVLDTIAPGRQSGTVRFRARAGVDSNPRAALSFRLGGTTLLTRTFAANTSTSVSAIDETLVFEGDVDASARLSVEMVLEGGSTNAKGWIDYVEAFYPRALQAEDGMVRFHTPGGDEGAAGGRFGFSLSGFSAAPEVWDVTEPGTVRRLGVQDAGGSYVVQVEAEPDAPRELVAFVPASARVQQAPRPEGGRPIANQNIHGVTGHPDYLVVTHERLLPAAERIAQRRAERDGLTPLVVTSAQVFNEFSGGKADFRAVRDFARLFYDRAGSDDQLPRFLFLFGDGHYDYRGLEENGDDNNLVPVYETVNMLVDDASFTSDDYFALLDEDEGTWRYPGYSGYSTERIDLGVGRVTARTLQEAEAYVDKVIRYEDPATYGAWRGRATYLADDSFPGNDRDIHVDNAENAAREMRDGFPAMNITKVYLPLYEAVQTAFGRRLPGAEADATRAFEDGTLIWNYSGHGSKDQLADERLFSAEVADRLTNLDRLTIGVTATCTFGRFDMITQQSGAERLILNPQGGAIAMFTTTRVVYTSSGGDSLNPGLNKAFTQSAFERGPDGRPRRLGDVMYFTKTRSLGANVPGAQGNSWKFALLGDPAVRIGLPERPVRITRLSGEDLPDLAPGDSIPPGTPALRALTQTVIEGEVLGLQSQADAGFTGEVEVLVYDAARRERIPEEQEFHVREGVEVRPDLIWRGRATATGGQFRATFVVPQDVSYSGAPGRIYAYARPTGGAALDGQGFSEAFTVSASAGDAADDGTGPQIRLFVGDSTFVEGGLVGPGEELVVELRDPSGLNAAGAGIGHELLLSVDGNEAEARDIGERFVADLDSYTSGSARVALPELEPGVHRVRVRAWDVTNNASEASLSFVVGEEERLALGSVYNYPNPMSRRTTFVVDHNRSGQAGRVLIRIYTVNGRLVRTLESDAALGPVAALDWDGRDEDGDRVGSGIYLYQVRVEAERPDGGREVSERLERLALIR